MKTVCKKLLCLMLVAMMLVSAVPAAFATGIERITLVRPNPEEVIEEEGNDGIETISDNKRGETPSTINYTINVGDWSKDEMVAYAVTTVSMTSAEKDELLRDQVDAAEELLHGTAYAADAAKEDNVHGVVNYSGSTEINVWLNSVSVGGSTGGNGGNGGGNGGTGGNGGSKYDCTLYIDYDGYASNRTVKATMGDYYLDLAGVPARPGYEFRGWFSEALDRFVKKGDQITENDTITAIWGNALKYSITFDVNRKGVEPINRIKSVTYGERIGDMPTPDTKDFVFMGWYINGKRVNENTIYEWQGDVVAYAKWEDESNIPGRPNPPEKDGDVYLEIYVNGDTDDLVRRVKMNSYAKDGWIDRDEVKEVVAKHVVAKNGYSLKYEGIFDEEDWWWYCKDPETDGSYKVKVDNWDDHYVYVMVKNVKKAVADSSNPKTGDNIMIAATTMALAGAALVAAVELKKRKMI